MNRTAVAAVALPTTTSTTAVDVSTIPATIDIAYVQRVFDVLDQIRGEVVKEFLAKRQLTPEMVARLGAVYNPQELQDQAVVLPELLKSDSTSFKQSPGTRRTVVQRLLTSRPDCVMAEVAFDVSAVVVSPGPSTMSYLRLEPRGDSSSTLANPTAFVIADQDTKPSDPCAARVKPSAGCRLSYPCLQARWQPRDPHARR